MNKKYKITQILILEIVMKWSLQQIEKTIFIKVYKKLPYKKQTKIL